MLRRVKRLEAFLGDAFLDHPWMAVAPVAIKEKKLPENKVKKITLQEYYEKLQKLKLAKVHKPESLQFVQKIKDNSMPEDCCDFIDCDTSDIELSPIKKK